MCAVGKSRLRAGFTLIELLMVMVIIGILFGILMPVVNGMKQRALAKKREAEVQLIACAIRNYHAENGVWPGNPQGGTFDSNNLTAMFNALCNNSPPLLDSNNLTSVGWTITIVSNTVTVQ
ncbi:MAG: prepilin-type N-terminal cleavage/methylation domain-containing protein [bacterium]